MYIEPDSVELSCCELIGGRCDASSCGGHQTGLTHGVDEADLLINWKERYLKIPNAGVRNVGAGLEALIPAAGEALCHVMRFQLTLINTHSDDPGPQRSTSCFIDSRPDGSHGGRGEFFRV